MCLRQITVAYLAKYSKTIPNCVLAKIQLNLLENILRQFQILSSQIPIESPQKYSKAIPNLVLANFQLNLLENILNNSKSLLSKIPIAFY